MPDFATPALPDDVAQPTGFLATLLAMSLTAIAVLRPLYKEGRICDFAWVRLNPAGQRILKQPEFPAASLLTLFPAAKTDGAFDGYCQAFETGKLTHSKTYYQADGLDDFFLIAAQRYEEVLVVNFADTSDRSHTEVEEALRESQLREQTARAEAERQRSELQRVFEQAPAAIAVYRGPNYTIELANPTVARLWGRTQEQLIGKGLFEALPEVAGMGYEQLLDEVMATGTPHVAHAMEAQHDRNGQRETVYWDFVYVPMYAADGHIDGAMVVANEVTAQVRARRQMEELNQQLEERVQERTQELALQSTRLARLLQEAPAAIAVLTGPDLVFELVNARYAALFPDRNLAGKPILKVLPELLDGPGAALLAQVQQTGVTFEGREVRMDFARPSDGQLEPRYFDFIYQARYDTASRIDGLVIFGFEVTDKMVARQQAEKMQASLLAAAQQQVRQREELYQLFAQAPVGVVLLREPDHRIDYYNPAYERLFPGWAQRGKTIAEAQPGMVEQGFVGLLDRVYTTGASHFGYEQLVVIPATQDAPEVSRYMNFTYQAYREEGRIAGVAVFVYDVTEQLQAREQVQQLNEELAAINEELTATNEELLDTNTRLQRTNTDLDTFVYAASHDLKAPIANIEGLLNALRDYLPVEAQEPMIARIMQMMDGAIARFQQTVGHLTDISHLQYGQRDSLEAPDIARIVEDVRLDILPLVESTHADVTVALEDTPKVNFSAKHMRSVFFNLLSNAIKYRAPGRYPQIQVRVYEESHRLVIQVQDNGLGLNEQQQNQLFMMFRRLHTHVEGSGVGLYLIKRAVENAGGTITVESQLGVGSTFIVTLPCL